MWEDEDRVEHRKYNTSTFIPFFVPAVMLWGMVFNLWVLRLYGVNYPFIFGFNPRKYLNIHQVMDLVSFFTAAWTFGCWAFIDHNLTDLIPAGKQIFVVFLVVLVALAWPFKVLYRSARFWILSVLVSAPNLFQIY